MEGGSDNGAPVEPQAGAAAPVPAAVAAGALASDAAPLLPCLVCGRCKAVVALASDIVAERIDSVLKSDVFSYELDIFDRE